MTIDRNGMATTANSQRRAGLALAASLTDLALIDEYRLYFRPFVLGRGKPYFAGARPPLRIIASDRVGEDAVRVARVPA